jgi:hypothetical protein
MAKSKIYKQDDDSKVSFEFGDDGKLIGIKKDGKSLDPQSQAFEDLQDSDDALEAYNINKFKGNIDAYEDIIDVNTDILIAQHEREEKKENNAQFLEDNTLNNDSIAFTVPKTGSAYKKTKTGGSSDLMAYPLDIDLEQDHFKITRYNYVRPDINQSKPRRTQKSLYGLRSHNVAGDSVIGSKIKGSIILPMPKPTDVNGAEWGKSELTVSGLAALGVANAATFGGRLIGKDAQQRFEDRRAKMAAGRPGDVDIFGRVTTFGQATYAQTLANMASNMAGTEIDTDTFLARTGGKVLNPNAEILFQGPVIRDFAFSFQMVARSEEEGKEIRKIIKFLKMGLAPKFNNTVFLENPDVFTLQYKNGSQDNDFIKNVNQFSPGGLALTTMNVDYAPSGYWSAYRDSQPVSVKMDLNFTELRPLYQQDHEETPEDSVGY